MNDNRRKVLGRAKDLLREAAVLVDRVCDQEEDSLDNMPENLQGSDRYEKIERAVDNLREAMEHIESAQTCITEATVK